MSECVACHMADMGKEALVIMDVASSAELVNVPIWEHQIFTQPVASHMTKKGRGDYGCDYIGPFGVGWCDPNRAT